MISPKYINQPTICLEMRLYGNSKPDGDAYIKELTSDLRQLVHQKARQKRHHIRVDWVLTRVE